MTDLHPLTSQIVTILAENSCWYETFTHEPVKTSEEAAAVRTGYTIKQGAKALIVKAVYKDKDTVFAMLVLPGDAKFSGGKVRKILNASDVRFASPEQVATITSGVEVGGVPPFGNLFRLPVILDKSLLDEEKIIFNAGDRKFSVAMKTADYCALVQPQVEEIC